MAAAAHRCGQRLSFDGHLCTVRYVGPVQGTKGDWLGVEWDDPTRGKHNGEHQGVKYFKCLRRSFTPASFVRPTRPRDKTRTIVGAVSHKYASAEFEDQQKPPSIPISTAVRDVIYISGKEVEEVGFDKVSKQLANLQELRILVLDDMCVGSDNASVATDLGKTCPNTRELDLSRNLIESWDDVREILSQVPLLTSLRLDGNRFEPCWREYGKHVYSLRSLGLDGCLIEPSSIIAVSQWLAQSLTTLSLRQNDFRELDVGSLSDRLTSIDLEGNEFTALSDLHGISKLKSLKSLVLKRNSVSKIFADQVVTKQPLSSSLSNLDLSYNFIGAWDFVDVLSTVVPNLKSLRMSGNPIYDNLKSADGAQLNADDGYILTIARVASLDALNFTPVRNDSPLTRLLSLANAAQITYKERLNAETYYLSQIAKELSLSHEVEESNIRSHHPRFNELCDKYGAPNIIRKTAGIYGSNSLAARLTRCDFRLADTVPTRLERHWSVQLPRSYTVYNILGLVGRHFGLPPMQLQLIWETGEKAVLRFGESLEDDDDEHELALGAMALQKTQDQDPDVSTVNKLLREEVLVPRTRNLGTWIGEASAAAIRVEWSEEERSRASVTRSAVEASL